MTRRVVITGLGIISALGLNVKDFWDNLVTGRCGIGEFNLFDHRDYRTHIAAEVKEIPDPAIPLFNSPLSKEGYRGVRRDRFSRSDKLGLYAARMAVEDAALGNFVGATLEVAQNRAGASPAPTLKIGVSLGVGVGGMLEGEIYHESLYKGRKARPSILISQQPSTTADLIAYSFGLNGIRTTIMTACSSSAVALGHALDMIRLGYQDVMIAGGVESLCRLTYSGFNSLRLVDADPCRPFDLNRKGLSLGEGSAFVILEGLDHAVNRKARIYSEFLGYGLSCDAGHITAPLPDGEGAALALKGAIKDAGILPRNIDYINAHGTATALNDAMETKAIKAVFGEKTSVPINSIKSMVGHTLGAAGAIEAVATVLSIYNGIIPPTINYKNPDPDCDLEYVVNRAMKKKIKIAISNSFAFGGNNACLVFRRWNG